MARIIDAPAVLEVVPVELLQKLAPKPPKSEKSKRAFDSYGSANGRQSGAFDLAAWINRNNLDVTGPEEWKGGRRWVFRTCPWNSDHSNGSAYIAQLAGGGISAGCHHNGCKDKGWHDLRDKVEPGWREQRNQKGTTTNANLATPPPAWQPFPTDVLPGITRRYLREASSAIGCDESYIALPLLAALASSIGNTALIVVLVHPCSRTSLQKWGSENLSRSTTRPPTSAIANIGERPVTWNIGQHE
jgi:hypothetical protein